MVSKRRCLSEHHAVCCKVLQDFNRIVTQLNNFDSVLLTSGLQHRPGREKQEGCLASFRVHRTVVNEHCTTFSNKD